MEREIHGSITDAQTAAVRQLDRAVSEQRFMQAVFHRDARGDMLLGVTTNDFPATWYTEAIELLTDHLNRLKAPPEHPPLPDASAQIGVLPFPKSFQDFALDEQPPVAEAALDTESEDEPDEDVAVGESPPDDPDVPTGSGGSPAAG